MVFFPHLVLPDVCISRCTSLSLGPRYVTMQWQHYSACACLHVRAHICVRCCGECFGGIQMWLELLDMTTNITVHLFRSDDSVRLYGMDVVDLLIRASSRRMQVAWLLASPLGLTQRFFFFLNTKCLPWFLASFAR